MESLPEQDAHGVLVRPVVIALTARLLGRHISVLALEGARAGLVCLGLGLGHAEVDELDRSVVAQEHVLRAHVAVDDVEALS